MGDDFRYQYAQFNFMDLDAMIAYMNKHFGHRYHFKYSTPSEYFDALHSLNLHWPTKTDDFLPYGDKKDAYWTGFYTSRPNLKGFISRAQNNFHASN